jgi:O-antigen ligase
MRRKRVWMFVTPLAAASVYFPVMVPAIAVLLLTVLAISQIERPALRAWAHDSRYLLWLLAWLAVTALWTPAGTREVLVHWWRYAALLAVPAIAFAVDRDAALAGMRTFVAASAVLALAHLTGLARLYPADGLLQTMFHYAGNKSIGNGVSLVVGAAVAVHLAAMPDTDRRLRVAFAMAAPVIAAAVMLHSASRTSGLVLVVMGIVLWWIHRRRRLAWAALVVLALSMAAVWWSGKGGLAMRQAAGQLSESNEIRKALYRGTWQMVQERPLLGHGIGSWHTLWRERMAGLPISRVKTAHQEWLQMAQQGGIVAAGLLLAVIAGWWRRAVAAGLTGVGGLAALVVAAWFTESLVNAAFRDGALAFPMIVLAALTLAATRRPSNEPPVDARPP